MTIQEAIAAVRNCEIVCRGKRERTHELISLLVECETKLANERRATVPIVADHSEELSAVKEELCGITSENIKYRNTVDALMGVNGELKKYIIRVLGSLVKFKRAVSVSPSVFNDYEVDEKKVLEAFRSMPNLMDVSPQLRNFLANGIKELEKNDSGSKNGDSEMVHIA